MTRKEKLDHLQSELGMSESEAIIFIDEGWYAEDRVY